MCGASRPGLVRPLFGRPAWFAYTACAVLVVAIVGVHRDLMPSAQDIFFLPSPLASITCITLLTYLLAIIHELCHWTAARAEGLDARVFISRPAVLPRVRDRPDAALGPAAEPSLQRTSGWYGVRRRGVMRRARREAGRLERLVAPTAGASQWLAALAFVELAALVAQAYVFARTDLYAVLVTATGCINLWRINQLRLLNFVGRLNAVQQRELAEAHGRDLLVARWYAVVYVTDWRWQAGFSWPTTCRRRCTWLAG